MNGVIPFAANSFLYLIKKFYLGPPRTGKLLISVFCGE